MQDPPQMKQGSYDSCRVWLTTFAKHPLFLHRFQILAFLDNIVAMSTRFLNRIDGTGFAYIGDALGLVHRTLSCRSLQFSSYLPQTFAKLLLLSHRDFQPTK